MRNLETKDWMFLNDIIYRIYTTSDFDEMRKNLLDQLKILIDFDSADFYIASSQEGKLLNHPITYNCDVDLSSMYEDIDASRHILSSGKMLIYRETDIISDEERIKTDYYKKVYKPNSWHYALQFIIARNKKFLGIITLYRTIGKEDFEYDDRFILDVIKDHLAFSLEQYISSEKNDHNKLTISQTVEKYSLTRREHTILKLLLQGIDNEKICEELVITPNTLKKHILNIYRKLGIKNRVSLFKMVKEYE